MKKIYLYALSLWMIFAIVSNLNNAFRDVYIIPNTSEYMGHVTSTFIFIGFIFFLTYIFLKSLKISFSSIELLWIGTMWVFLTILFEFIFGHYIMDHPWSKILANYNLLNGRIWIFVFVATFIAPYLCGKYRIK